MSQNINWLTVNDGRSYQRGEEASSIDSLVFVGGRQAIVQSLKELNPMVLRRGLINIFDS
jgi:hypothetical protein